MIRNILIFKLRFAMNPIKYKRIIILGSGFSKSISSNMPTLKDLSESLLKLNDQVNYHELTEFISKFSRLSEKNREISTIENIATIILSKSFFYNNEEKIYYEILQHQLLRWIFDKIEAHAPTVDREKQANLIRFFNQCCYSPEEKDTLRPSLVMTFNYDLLVERLLQPGKSQMWKFDYIINLNRYLTNYQENRDYQSDRTFEYLKLHGSLNWFTAPGAERIDLSDVFLVDDSDPSKNLIHYKDIPVYIPMAFSKMNFMKGSLYNVLWNIARRYLDETEEIVFIGYGFPQSDIDNLYFFLQYKSKISDIVVHEKTDMVKIKRIKKVFRTSNVINRDAYDYIVSLI